MITIITVITSIIITTIVVVIMMIIIIIYLHGTQPAKEIRFRRAFEQLTSNAWMMI